MTMTAPETVRTAFDQVDPLLRQTVARLDPDLELVAGYHLGWLNADGSAVEVPGGYGGKRIRAALALLSARAAGAPGRAALTEAVAVELVHNFSLLHDDVMDNDIERRHRPTAWHVFGVGEAILAGDALLALAMDLLDTAGPQSPWVSQCLLGAVHRLIAGQSMDLALERASAASLPTTLEMMAGKTAALLGCACSIGALAVAGPGTLAIGLAEFGNQVGIAFQIVDDLLGIWGEPERTGKPRWSDLRARKLSAPVAAALADGGVASRRLGELYAPGQPLREEDLETAADLVEQAGGRAWAEREADRRIARARRELTELELPTDVEAELLRLANYVVGRDR